MNIEFNNILVPVDFSSNTEAAIKQALMLCEGVKASIHLLHAPKLSATNLVNLHQNYPDYNYNNENTIIQQAKRKMEKLKKYISLRRKNVSITAWLSYKGPVETAIIEKAKDIKADLIVIGKCSYHKWLPFLNTVVSARIARKSGISVLTVKPGGIENINTLHIPDTFLRSAARQVPMDV